MTTTETVEITRELIRRAILTLAAIPDPDARFRGGLHSAWPEFRQEISAAYGAVEASAKVFVPTAADIGRMYAVLRAYNEFRRRSPTDKQTARLFTAWVFGVPMWMLQQRCSTNRRCRR